MRYVGFVKPFSALAAEILSGRRLPEVDRLLGRGTTTEKPEPLIRCRAECGRGLPLSAFSPENSRRGHYPYCRECAAARAREKYRASAEVRARSRAHGKKRLAEQKARGWTDAERARAREAAAAYALSVQRKHPDFGRCVVCGGPVAKRRQRQKTCSRRCLGVVQAQLMTVRRAGGDASSIEAVIAKGGDRG